MKNNSVCKIFLIFALNALSIHINAQKIGLVMDSYVVERWALDQKLFTDKIRSLGGEVKVEVAYGDAAEQLRLSQKLIDEGVKVLVVIPVNGSEAVKIAKAAKAAKIPLLSYDRLIASNDVTIYISYNNEKVGELQAQSVMKRKPRGKYLLINGPVSDNNAVLFREGQLKILKPSIDSGKIKILGDFIMSDWGELGALMKADEFFSTSKEKPDVIIAANDALASGVIQSLPPDLLGKILVTGQDADITAIKYIIAGTQTLTIYKPIKPLAYIAAETAMKLATSEPVHGKTKLHFGDKVLDAILLDPVVVDKTNYKETVVKDGHVLQSQLVNKN